MRTVVSVQDLVELEIKPEPLLAEFRALTASSVQEAFPERSLVPVGCPACDAEDAILAFTKLGLTYRECRRCDTLYVSPRPHARALEAYYRDSPAAAFWRDRVLAETGSARLEKLIAPRSDWVLEGLAEHARGERTGVDLSANGAPLREMLSTHGLRFADTGPADFALAFDAFDRAADLPELIAALRAELRPHGLLFATVPSASGFEVQTLWERSDAVLPPDKLNVPSIEGLRRRFGPPEWEILELSTPGMFDVHSVRREVQREPDLPWPRFVRSLALEADEEGRAAFQEFLQRTRRASFARLIARRAF